MSIEETLQFIHSSSGSNSKTSYTARRAALQWARIEDFRFHDLRHTWVSCLIQSNVPMSALKDMGGWESVEMVQRYTHLAPNHLTEHARQIDEVLAVMSQICPMGKI